MKTMTAAGLAAVISIMVWLAEQVAHAQNIGEIGYLKSAGMGTNGVPVFTDSKTLDAFYAAYLSNDEEGANELISAGRAFIVPAGTKVRVLSGGFFDYGDSRNGRTV